MWVPSLHLNRRSQQIMSCYDVVIISETNFTLFELLQMALIPQATILHVLFRIHKLTHMSLK